MCLSNIDRAYNPQLFGSEVADFCQNKISLNSRNLTIKQTICYAQDNARFSSASAIMLQAVVVFLSEAELVILDFSLL